MSINSELGSGGKHKASKCPREQCLDLNNGLKTLFLETSNFDQHYNAQTDDRDNYVATMVVMAKNGVKLSRSSRIQGLAAAWARKDNDLADFMLQNRAKYGPAEVSKVLEVLDSGRKIRIITRKIKIVKAKRGVKVKQTLGKLKSDLDNLNRIKPKHGSATGAVCRKVRRWVRTFTKEELEFFALCGQRDSCKKPLKNWRLLAQICHLNPKKDFPVLPWFLEFCHGQPPPEDSVVHCCSEINIGNVNTLLKNYALPYTVIKAHIKTPKSTLQPASKAKIAEYDRFDRVIWNIEELNCDDVDKVVEMRMKRGEDLEMPYEKLMERIITMETKKCDRPIKLLKLVATKKLQNIRLCLEPPVVVMGDRSASMEVAIKTSTIITSTLAAIKKAKLVFFNNTNFNSNTPADIDQVRYLASNITACSRTCPAVSLMPFYRRKEVVKTFFVVTDEEENGTCENYRFSDLFKKYHDEIYPSTLVFLSLLNDQRQEGQMVTELRRKGLKPLQFKFNKTKPDLTKLCNLFGRLASNTGHFEKQVHKMKKEISRLKNEVNGLKSVIDEITSAPDPKKSSVCDIM